MDGFTVNEDFAKKYDKYREKEELQKLKSRYGDVDSETGSSESEDENAEAVTPGLERDFLRTLSYLKKRDPAIYDQSKKFYEDPESDESAASSENEKQNATKPMYLKDYERKVILENEGRFIEDTSDNEVERGIREASPSYQEEQEKLKKDFAEIVHETVNGEEGGELLVKRTKSSKEKEKEEEDFRKWLKTPEAQTNLSNVDTSMSGSKMNSIVAEVTPLKQFWADPNLDEGEKFLRDYILERKYLDHSANRETPTYDEIIGAPSDDEVSDTEDELFQKKSEMFEHKYNFRFEEPDQEFIKSYPRTIGTSVRRRDEARKKKREEKKMKDEEKKRKKQEELKQLKALKKKEILDKINKLQEATGNKDVGFNERDLEVDFDPETYDKRMQEIFSNYDDDFEEEKPVFSDLEEEMEDYEGCWDEEDCYEGGDLNPDCEDPDFIMDCDYDPVHHQEKKDLRKSKKNKNPNTDVKNNKTKKSAFYDSVSRPKPAFDPSVKTFDKYLDEYYALDYEDLIGDLPCRFKYRQVVPNDFGLTTDEILTANDRELNAWCSLKRTVQYRNEDDEEHDVRKYKRKGRNVWKKARVLKSVYKMPGEEDEKKSQGREDENNNTEEAAEGEKKMNSRKRRRLRERAEKMKLLHEDDPGTSMQGLFAGKLGANSAKSQSSSKEPKIRKKTKENFRQSKAAKLSHDRLKAYGLEPKKFLKKLKYGNAGAQS